MNPTKLLSAAALLLATAAAQAGITNYYATLVPEGDGGRTGSGFVTASFDDTTNVLAFNAEFSGLSGLSTVAHFHCCTALPFPATALVAVDSPSLPIPTGVSAGTFGALLDLDDVNNFNPAFVTASGGTVGAALGRFLQGLNNGEVYFNIHSSRFGGGEIRGTMQVPEPASGALALLGLVGLAGLAGRQRRAAARG